MLIPTLQFCSCCIAAGLRGWRAAPIGCSEQRYITLLLLYRVRYEAVSAGFVDCQDCAASALL
jgi:hypothetical protein